MYLLDTNVVSELKKVKNGQADPDFSNWFSAIAQSACYISVITVFELEMGVALMERRDVRQGRILRNWLEKTLSESFSGRILDVDTNLARVCARFHVPNPRPVPDSLIAATALVHDLTMVTRNLKDFEGMGLRLVDPWLSVQLRE